MKNIKLNNLIRKFMTLTYILAVLAGITLGISVQNWWAILLVPLFSALFLLWAYFLNIWVEHRYVTYPYERNVRVTIDANKVLNKEIEELKAEMDELIEENQSLKLQQQ